MNKCPGYKGECGCSSGEFRKDTLGIVRNRLAFKILLVLLFIILSPYAFAAEIKLAWDPPEYSDRTLLAGYRVYYGTAPGVYGQSVDVQMSEMVINNWVYPLTVSGGAKMYQIGRFENARQKWE